MKAQSITLDETAQALFTDNLTELGIITVYNPNSETIFVKLWEVTTAPTVASDAPTLALACPEGVTNHVFFSGFGVTFIAATEESGAGATAPTSDLIATVTSVRVNG
jgi:hypothetical protein